MLRQSVAVQNPLTVTSRDATSHTCTAPHLVTGAIPPQRSFHMAYSNGLGRVPRKYTHYHIKDYRGLQQSFFSDVAPLDLPTYWNWR